MKLNTLMQLYSHQGFYSFYKALKMHNRKNDTLESRLILVKVRYLKSIKADIHENYAIINLLTY